MSKQRVSKNPEVQAAVEERDGLVEAADEARKEVDRLKDELLDQYDLAEEQRKRNGGR